MPETEALKYVRVVSYDPAWPRQYAEERARLIGLGDARLMELEHIGSTAVPGLCAKPIIDMMAAVIALNQGMAFALRLNSLGYELIETGMNARFFLRRRSEADGQVFHLHIVERGTWDLRKERLMR
ncbi:MAG TPA: GrpB family protein, partial [Steroidobacteraceae bacterium]